MHKILQKYNEKCSQPSDINELLPFIKEYADKVDHITEMGVRNPTSTYAFLAGNPKKLISYDIGRYPEVDIAESIAKEEGVDFQFILQDVLQADIEETDFLFIDTFHTATQLERELNKHSGKVRKYIGFHDTTTFWETGEPWYPGVPSEVACGRGLKYALEPFLASHPEWRKVLRVEKNNGLTIIEKS